MLMPLDTNLERIMHTGKVLFGQNYLLIPIFFIVYFSFLNVAALEAIFK